MKKLLNSLGTRVLAFILLMIFVAVFAASFVGVVALTGSDAYQLNNGGLSGDIYRSWCYEQSENMLAKFAIEGTTEGAECDSAYAYILTDKDGNVVEDTLGDKGYQLVTFPQSLSFVEEHTYQDGDTENGIIVYHGSDGYGYTWAGRSVESEIVPAHDSAATESAESDDTENEEEAKKNDTVKTRDAEPDGEADERAAYSTELAPYSLVGYVLAEIPADSEIYVLSRVMSLLNAYRYDLLIIAVGTGLASIALFVFLMAAAGRRAPDGAVTPTWVERVPFDVYSAVMLVAGVGCLGLIFSLAEQWRMDMALGALMGVSVVAFAAVAVLWCMSLSVRVKLKTVISSCVCYKILAWCWKAFRRVLVWCKNALAALVGDVKTISFVPRVVLIVLAVLIVEFVFMVNTDVGDHLVAWFFERAVLVALGIYLVAAMKRLLTAGREIASGNVEHRVDTARMHGALKEHGEDLNRITDGMNKAIAERVKSERFKTELITNVSHDIKTPLTSIVNYVDLLEKEEMENDTAREYLEVLSRQSARLKKLIEDLMEASKASTGNLAVNPERCDLGVMLTQTAGEYAEKLSAAGLELIVDKPEENVYIMADRQQLWRVFDNLMNNICKYSLDGTRVYLELRRVTRTSGESLHPGAAVTFRNISKTRLTVAGDELAERFVRGDSSRNTEGSGLGLSIANSLTELQGGKMTLVVDGDLFKVQLTFYEVK